MTTWNSFIEQSRSTNDTPTTTDTLLIPLDDLALLGITGDDAQAFLQNLVTNDVNSLSINQSQLAGLCNPKGRLFAVFLIIKLENSFLLVLPKTTLPILKQRLSMYILRSQVVITDETENLACLGIIAKTADAAITNLSLPTEEYRATNSDNITIIKLPAKTAQRYLAISNTEALTKLIDQTVSTATVASNDEWLYEEILAGIPAVYQETKETFTPQQINLDQINGVSFKKGCYPGQEIVARLHYLGSPSRRMFIAKTTKIQQNSIGKEIHNKDNIVAGHIVNLATKGESSYLLVSIKLSEIDDTLFYEKQALTVLKE